MSLLGSGEWRPTLNLKVIDCIHTSDPSRSRLWQPVYLCSSLNLGGGASLDLKDTYLHVPLHESARRWRRLRVKGAAYIFWVTPFGLSKAPGSVTRGVKTIAECQRGLGVRIFIYLDEWHMKGFLSSTPPEGWPHSVRAWYHDWASSCTLGSSS